MRTRSLLALVLLAAACTTSDKLIISGDAAAMSDAPSTGGAPASGGTGGTSDPGTGGTSNPGAGGTSPTDAAVLADAPSSSDAPAAEVAPPADGAPADAVSALTCSALPACGAGQSCFCCPLGLRVEHCTCSVECTTDTECPTSAPHCNVRKVMGVPIGKGFCTEPTFICAF